MSRDVAMIASEVKVVAEVRHERRYLHPRLSHVLSELAGSPMQQALADRVAEVGTSGGLPPTSEALREALAAPSGSFSARPPPRVCR